MSEKNQAPQPQDSRENAPDILVVDDTIANLQLLAGLLKDDGYRVRPVTSGELALRAAEKRKPDLILLDINMPEMDGYQVCERLKADRQLASVPVIFISALSDTLDKVKAFRSGGVDYVTKPFQFEEVRARVETHLRIRQLQDQLKTRNQELREKNQRLEELSELTEHLTSLIVHDLRAPLGGVMGYLELLQINSVGQLADEFREDIDKALGVARQMSELINSLLDVRRLEKAELPLKIARSDIAELADEALTSLESLAEFRNLDTDFPEEPAIVECDPTLTRRVIINLLHNALKFTARNGRILVKVESQPTRVKVSVSDDGPGIPSEYQDKVFDRFGLADYKSRRQGALPGLGLTFCKLCVEAHGGEIGVESTEKAGSTFWFKLPKTS